MAEESDAPAISHRDITTHVIADVPNARRRPGRIPDTPQRRRLERVRNIRQSVFGMQDGIITTLGIVTGVGQAAGNHAFIILSGLISMLAGALSMAVGEYLGGTSEQEVIRAALDHEKLEIAQQPQAEYTEQVHFYLEKGFTAEEAEMIVKRLIQNPTVFLHEMVLDEFGVDPRSAEGVDYRGVFAMAGFFALGSLLPIVPYFIPALDGAPAVGASLVLATAGLFGIGFFAGTLGDRNPWAKGLQVVVLGAVVFGVTFAAGLWASHLLPHSPPLATG